MIESFHESHEIESILETLEVFMRDGSKCFTFLNEDRELIADLEKIFDKENIENTVTSALIMRKRIMKDF
jgi:hypothetical protein